MENNEFDNDDIDFSIIAPDSDKPKAVDFSVNSLLADPEMQNNIEKQEEPAQEYSADPEGSFMRDLGKIEKSISY